MSRSLVPVKAQILTNQAMAANFVSPVIDTWQCDAVSWEGAYTTAANGVFTIEGSNQYDAVTNPNPTFVPMPAPTPAFPVPAGAAGTFIVTSPGIANGGGGARYQRLRYAASSGAATFNLWVIGVGRT